MNIKDIKELTKILENSDLSVIEVCEGDTKIRLERNITAAPGIAAPAPQVTTVQTDNAVNFNHTKEIKAPMVGIFYSAPSPDSEPYVKVGSKVKKGDVVCIIEAMKLMNEITAETDGEIVDICTDNGELVEFSQTLFRIM